MSSEPDDPDGLTGELGEEGARRFRRGLCIMKLETLLRETGLNATQQVELETLRAEDQRERDEELERLRIRTDTMRAAWGYPIGATARPSPPAAGPPTQPTACVEALRPEEQREVELLDAARKAFGSTTRAADGDDEPPQKGE